MLSQVLVFSYFLIFKATDKKHFQGQAKVKLKKQNKKQKLESRGEGAQLVASEPAHWFCWETLRVNRKNKSAGRKKQLGETLTDPRWKFLSDLWKRDWGHDRFRARGDTECFLLFVLWNRTRWKEGKKKTISFFFVCFCDIFLKAK